MWLPVPVIKMPAAQPPCPFLSSASPKLWPLLYPTSTSGNLRPPYSSIPGLPLPALFLLPQTWASPWVLSPLHPAHWCQAGPSQGLCSSPAPRMGALAKILPWCLPKPQSPNPALRGGICAQRHVGRTTLQGRKGTCPTSLPLSHR